MNLVRKLAAIALSLAGLVAASAQPRTSNPPATLRIGLWTLWHDKEITVSPTQEGSATLRVCETCAAAPLTRFMRIRANGVRLAIADNRKADAVWLTGPVTLIAHGETLTLRNPLRISARSGELVLAVTLPVEAYVERVVASESGPADGPESLKALAVVVRTFALHQAHGHAAYDLCDSTHCQILHWGGKPDLSEKLGPQKSGPAKSSPTFLAQPFAELPGSRAAAHAATLATAGEALWFHGQRAQAWFHQNCGGRTASPEEVWPVSTAYGRGPMPWLISRMDPYCTANGAREWSADLSLADLTSALAAAGLVRPGWTKLVVARRGQSGRAVVLAADSTQISAEDFRLAVGHSLGWSRILSTWFEVSRQGEHFLFHGRGSGHGVGLCQAGAAVMSAQGRDSAQILAQYFPGAIAADESTGRSWQTLRGQRSVLETLNPSDASYLGQLNHALADAEARAGLQPTQPITVRAFNSTPAFRDATQAPGWVAAFTEGNWIATQPLSTLSARKLLPSVLRHEFLHALVEARAAPTTPLWLREGLVEALDSESKSPSPAPALRLNQINQALANAATESQAAAGHRAAAWYAARLLARFGRDQVMSWLQSGLPASGFATIQ